MCFYDRKHGSFCSRYCCLREHDAPRVHLYQECHCLKEGAVERLEFLLPNGEKTSPSGKGVIKKIIAREKSYEDFSNAPGDQVIFAPSPAVRHHSINDIPKGNTPVNAMHRIGPGRTGTLTSVSVRSEIFFKTRVFSRANIISCSHDSGRGSPAADRDTLHPPS
jgi:hypothetical protein